MKNLKIDLRLSLHLYIKNLIKRAPSIAVLALTIFLIYGSASPTTALPALPDRNLTPVAAAQPTPERQNAWSSQGPWGGYVVNLAIAPSNPDILYGWTENEVFKSTDGCASWGHLGRTRYPVRYVAIDTFNPETLYVLPNVGGAMVSKSTDGGNSWKDIGPPDVTVLAMDRANPTTVYTLDSKLRLSKSTDGGANWSRSDKGLPEYSESGFVYGVVAVSPSNSQNLYTASPRMRAEDQGLYRSTDGGANWSRVSVGPFRNLSMSQLVVAQASSTVLYARTLEGYFRSTDDGANWSAFSVPNVTIASLSIDPRNVAVVYVGTSDGRVLKSTDGGTSWSEANVGSTTPFIYGPSIFGLVIDPRNTTTLYAGTGSGVFKSTDGGSHWQEANSGLSVSVQNVTAGNDGGVFAGGVPFRSTDNGAHWDRAGLSGGVNSWAIDPSNSNIIYAANYDVSVYRSTDRGASWNALDLTSRHVFSVAIAPGNPTLLYAGTDGNGVIQSTDSGARWVRISKNLDNAYLVKPDPSNSNTLYAASRTICDWDFCGLLFKSTDGGVTWNRPITPSPTNEWISALAFDPENPRILYATDSGSVIKSIDGGETWSAIGSNGLSVNDLVIDPINSATLYAGAISGVIRTTDGGATWDGFNNGLPAFLEIRALAFDASGTYLHMGTNIGIFDYHFATPCVEPLFPADQSFAAGGGAGFIKVTAATECGWSAASNVDWIGVTSATSSSGSGTVSYSVAANESTAPRTGRISIDARDLKVTQGGVPVRISRAMVSGRALFVFGENFDPGAVILLNGEEQITKQPASGPQASLIGKKAGKRIKSGDSLKVRNPNGTLSTEFIFTG
jgi:photosystem II stability/assembly factor-like uncharacterized protein